MAGGGTHSPSCSLSVPSWIRGIALIGVLGGPAVPWLRLGGPTCQRHSCVSVRKGSESLELSRRTLCLSPGDGGCEMLRPGPASSTLFSGFLTSLRTEQRHWLFSTQSAAPKMGAGRALSAAPGHQDPCRWEGEGVEGQPLPCPGPNVSRGIRRACAKESSKKKPSCPLTRGLGSRCMRAQEASQQHDPAEGSSTAWMMC